MATSAELIDSSKCYDQCIPEGAKLGVLIYLAMVQAGLNMTPTELLENAKCYYQCIPQGAMPGVLAYLYDNGGGGGGGGGTIQVFQDRDPLPPDDVTKAAVSYNSSTQVITQWNIAGQIWV